MAVTQTCQRARVAWDYPYLKAYWAYARCDSAYRAVIRQRPAEDGSDFDTDNYQLIVAQGFIRDLGVVRDNIDSNTPAAIGQLPYSIYRRIWPVVAALPMHARLILDDQGSMHYTRNDVERFIHIEHVTPENDAEVTAWAIIPYHADGFPAGPNARAAWELEDVRRV